MGRAPGGERRGWAPGLPPRAWAASDARCSTCRGSGGSGCRPGPTPIPASPTPGSTTAAGGPAGAVPLAAPATARPLHPAVLYPFPVDPPHVPTENPTGDHRLRFRLPADWDAERTVLRFEGADSPAGVAERPGAGQLDREPAAGRARRHRRPGRPRRGQPAGRTGAAVVGGQLPGGPGHVVAVRRSSGRCGCWPARPGGSTTTSSTPATTMRRAPAPSGSTPACRPRSPCPSWGWTRPRRRSGSAVEPWSAETPRLATANWPPGPSGWPCGSASAPSPSPAGS